MISIPYGKLLYLQAACQRECPQKLFLRPNMRQDFKIQLKVTICSCLVRFKTIIEECLTWGRHEKGGRFIYSEIEIGKVSAFEVKQHRFAGTVALQNEQVARGGSLEDASNHLPTQGTWQLSAPETHPWTQESIFLLLKGTLGRGEKRCCRMKTNAILIGL